jgi:AraC-like DNA-binding protein
MIEWWARPKEEADMDVLNRWSSEHEAQRAQANRAELIARLAQAIHNDGMTEPLDGVRLRRASTPTEIGHGVSFPSFCVIAQGSKEILLSDHRYWYDSAHYLIATTALPIASRIAEASEERPYLSVMVTLDPALISAVMSEAAHVVRQRRAAVTAIDVSPLDRGLLDAVVRLVRLLDSPSEVRFLLPLLKREIIYRLLSGPQRERVVQMAALGRPTERIAEALDWLRRDFNRPLRIEEIARELGMSASGFHHHFKALTAMSPLQFQKQLRLQEARRLMLGEGLDAANAGFRVGFDDASYFNREYKKLFGEPPMRDVERLREDTSNRALHEAAKGL